MRALNIFVFNFILIFFVSCSKSEDAEIILAMDGSPITLDPFWAQDAYSTRIVSLIFDGLVRIDNFVPKPHLAEKIEIEGKRLKISLRKNVLFHNGKELDSDDVLYTFSKLITSSSPRSFPFKNIKIKKTGKYTVEIELDTPFAPFLTSLAQPIVSETSSTDEPNGTGPFIPLEYKRGQYIILKSNKNYFMSPPKFNTLKIKFVPDDTSRILEFEKGDINIIVNAVPFHFLPKLRKEKANIIETEGINLYYLAFNMKREFTSDLRLRKAIFCTINEYRERLIEGLTFNSVESAFSILPKKHWAYYFESEDRCSSEDAVRIINEIKREKGIEKIPLVWKTSTNKTALRIATALSSYLERVGIDINLVQREFSTFFSEIQRGEYDIHSLIWVGVVEPDIFRFVFHSKSIPPNGANRTFFSNPYLDTLLEKGAYTWNTEERKYFYAKAQKILLEEKPYIYLWHIKDIVLSRCIENIHPLPGGDLYFLKDIKKRC